MKNIFFVIRLIFSVWSYFVFATVISFGFVFLAAPAYFVSKLFVKKPKAVFQWLTRLGFNITFFLSPIIRKIEITGRSTINNTKPAIFVPTHRSFLDYLLMESIIYDIVFLTNKKTSQFILFRYIASLLGAHLIDRKNPVSYYALFSHFKESLAKKTNILIFPEGTRNGSETLRPFHNGAFKLSVETGVPIVPVLILNSDEIAPKGHLIAQNNSPVTVKIVFLEPVHARDNETASQFAKRIQTFMQSEQDKARKRIP